MGEVKATMNSTARRLLLGTAFTIAGIGVGLGCQSAAHADDTVTAAVQRPGGTLDGVVQLPAQASDTARAAVAKVAPNPKPSKPADKPKPKPAKDPTPTTPPAAEPTHAPKPPTEDKPTDGRPTEPPVEVPAPPSTDPIGDVVDDAADGLEDAGEVIPTPTAPAPVPAPTVPAPIPTPTLPATPTAPAAEPTLPVVQPAALPTAVLPAAVPPLPGLPILIGPTATPATLDPARAHDEPLVAAPVPLCTDDLDAIHVDLKRITIPVNLRPHRKATATAGGPPCPGTPGTPDGPAVTMLTVKPPPPNGQQLVADSVAGAYSRPVLHRLTQLRPRGDLPAGRTQHPEPGPA